MVYRRTETVLARLAKRRDAIINTAIACVDRDGFESLNVNVVADQARIAVGTIYLHIPNRDELIAAVVARCAQDHAMAVGSAAIGLPPMKALAAAINAYVHIFSTTRRLLPALMGREPYRKAIVGELARIIVRGQEHGMAAGNADMLALAIVGALNAVLVSRLDATPQRLTALVEAVLRIADVNPATYREHALEEAS